MAAQEKIYELLLPEEHAENNNRLRTILKFLSTNRILLLLLRTCVRVVCAACILGTAILGVLWFLQEKLLFHPRVPGGHLYPDRNAPPLQNPMKMNMPYEDVGLQTDDGVDLHSWLIKQPGDSKATSPTIIFFQGNAGNMGFRLPNILGLYKSCGANILALHYRGYGYSLGFPTEEGLYKDAQAALDMLVQREDIDKKKIFIFGRSIGGAVAIDLASKPSNAHYIRGLIVENTFSSLDDMTFVVFPFLRPLKYLVCTIQRLKMSSKSKIGAIKVPTMFVSGLQDELVPPEQMKRLYDLSGASVKLFYPVKNGTHNDTWQKDTDAYFLSIARFIQNVLKEPRTIADDRPPTTRCDSSAVVDGPTTTSSDLRAVVNRPTTTSSDLRAVVNRPTTTCSDSRAVVDMPTTTRSDSRAVVDMPTTTRSDSRAVVDGPISRSDPILESKSLDVGVSAANVEHSRENVIGNAIDGLRQRRDTFDK